MFVCLILCLRVRLSVRLSVSLCFLGVVRDIRFSVSFVRFAECYHVATETDEGAIIIAYLLLNSERRRLCIDFVFSCSFIYTEGN